MIVSDADFDSVLFIARNMREKDRAEIFATMWDEDEELLANIVCVSGYAFCLGKDEPIMTIWGYPSWPGVWQIGMFATDRFSEIALSATRWVKRHFLYGIVQGGAIRGEAKSIDGHDVAHRWMEMLGAEREATHRCYGKNGETFHTYAWTKLSPKYPFWR